MMRFLGVEAYNHEFLTYLVMNCIRNRGSKRYKSKNFCVEEEVNKIYLFSWVWAPYVVCWLLVTLNSLKITLCFDPRFLPKQLWFINIYKFKLKFKFRTIIWKMKWPNIYWQLTKKICRVKINLLNFFLTYTL